MNPILPDHCFVPDAEARVMPDGRLYLYGSWDISGSDAYCSRELHCFSTDDMKTWIDHGVIFRNDEDFTGIPWNPKTALYAPDAIHKDGKYYLYVCGSGREEGVAVADSPVGPFSAAQKIEIADGDSIDPTVFVDDDGRAYYFWGQFTLRGGELCSDMKTLKSETIKSALLTEWEHGFHEGASIRKRGDKYYMIYTDISRGKATCLSYAVADEPLGPYKKGGVIIDNVYCDPNSWNDHGSIAEYRGQWYVFYHRSSQNRNTCRRVCVEKIEFDENGMIKEVVQTSSGCEDVLDARQWIPARAACRMMGRCMIDLRDGQEFLVSHAGGHWGISDWVEYKYLDFGSGGEATISVTAKGKGKITLKTDGDRALCTLNFDQCDFLPVSANLDAPQGKHTLWLLLEGELEVKGLVLK